MKNLVRWKELYGTVTDVDGTRVSVRFEDGESLGARRDHAEDPRVPVEAAERSHDDELDPFGPSYRAAARTGRRERAQERRFAV